MTITDVLFKTEKSFYIKDNDYSTLKWNDDSPKPTLKELETKLTELEQAYQKQEYARKRKLEYPDIQECIHAILDDDLEALQAKRVEVKLKFPKPE